MRKREAAAEVAAIPVGQLQREAAAIQRELASCPSESRAVQLGAEKRSLRSTSRRRSRHASDNFLGAVTSVPSSAQWSRLVADDSVCITSQVVREGVVWPQRGTWMGAAGSRRRAYS